MIMTMNALALMALMSSPAHPPVKKPAMLDVDNTRGVPVIVYLDRGDFDVRLGRVAPYTTSDIPLPSYLADGDVARVFVHPEGGEDLSSQDVTVNRGAKLDVYVPKNDVGYLPPPPPVEISNPGPNTTTVTIDNLRDVPVTLFAEHGDFDTRIGTVPANKRGTLEVPNWLTREQEDVEFFVHPEKGVDLASQFYPLKKGDHLFIQVQAG